MGLAEVLARITRIDNETTNITIQDNSSEPQITIDEQLSTVSTNPVQNKVITNRINSISGSLNSLENEVNDLDVAVSNKMDYSPYIRKIYIGNDTVPSNSVGQDGDLYIYRPQE